MKPRYQLFGLIAMLSLGEPAIGCPGVNGAEAEAPCLVENAVVMTNGDGDARLAGSLRQLAAVSEKDTSAPLKSFKSKMLPPITAAEAQALRKAVGRCSCTIDNEFGSGRHNTDCTIAGTTGGNMTLISAGHLIIDFFRDGELMPGLMCRFTNRAGDKPVELNFRPGSYRVGTLDAEKDEGNDRLVVRLKKPIRGAREFPVFASGLAAHMSIHSDMPVYAISAGLGKHVGTEDLVAQECTVYARVTGQMVSDCTSIRGQSSGMPMFARGLDGRLVLLAVTTRSSPEERNGQPAVVNDKGNNLTSSMVIELNALTDLLKIEKQNEN